MRVIPPNPKPEGEALGGGSPGLVFRVNNGVEYYLLLETHARVSTGELRARVFSLSGNALCTMSPETRVFFFRESEVHIK